MKYHTIFFDIDGTITDSAPAILFSLQKLLFEETGMFYSLDQLEFALGLPNTELGAHFHLPEWETLLKKGADYYRQSASSITIFDGMEETISALKKNGIRLGIITSKTSAQYENGFASLPLSNYFECVICADETAYFKPHPAPVFEGIRRLRVSLAGTLFVGDSANDMLCAQAAGIDSALALWGCRRPDQISATHRLSHPGELLQL